jgi:hypothetical protein
VLITLSVFAGMIGVWCAAAAWLGAHLAAVAAIRRFSPSSRRSSSSRSGFSSWPGPRFRERALGNRPSAAGARGAPTMSIQASPGSCQSQSQMSAAESTPDAESTARRPIHTASCIRYFQRLGKEDRCI